MFFRNHGKLDLEMFEILQKPTEGRFDRLSRVLVVCILMQTVVVVVVVYKRSSFFTSAFPDY